MNRQEAETILKTQDGVKLTHSFFSSDEFIYKDGDIVRTEEGYLFEDWYSTGVHAHNGFRSREGEGWDTGWSYYQEVTK